MIPVSLQIRNFLSYGEDVPPLDFSEFDVACLSGDNGHGKSAILDAMTWALWGEARKAIGEKSPSDGLLRIGTREMQVELEFDLEGDRYRILRKYHRKKRRRGSASLEFQVFDETACAYNSLSEKSMRATQAKINATLRMTYETFINSAFILQGHVDEFTKRNPTQRKAILANILDLSRYESLRELAREHFRSVQSQHGLFTQQLKIIAEEVQHKAEYEHTLEELKKTLAELDETLQTHETQRQTLEQQRAELQGKQQQLSSMQGRQKQLRQECQQLDRKITRQEQQLNDVNELLSRERDILTRYKRYLSLQTRNDTCEENRRQQEVCQKEQRSLEQAIQDARHGLEKEIEKRQAERAQVQKTLDETRHILERTQEIETGFQELQTCREQDEAWETQRNRVEELERSARTVEQAITREKNRLEVELQSAERHIAEVQSLADKQPEREKQVETSQQQLTRLEALEQELEQNKEAGPQCRAAVDGLKERQKHLKQNLKDIEEKCDLLKRSDQPQCPLCQSALDHQKKHEIEAHFQQEIAQIHQEDQRLTHELEEQNARLQELRTEYKRLEGQIKKLEPVRKQVIQAENALQESQRAAAQVQELRTSAEAVRNTLKNKAYSQDEHQQLVALQQEQEKIGYDAKAHQRLKQRIKTLQKFEGDYSKLEDTRERQRKALAQLPEIEQKISAIQTTLARQDYAHPERVKLEEVLTRIRKIGYDGKEHDHIRKDLQQVQDAPTQKAQLDQAGKSLGTLRQELDEYMSERQQKAEQIAELNKQMIEYEQELEKLPAIRQAAQDNEKTLRSLRKQRDDLLQTQGTYQHKFDRCQQLEADYAQQKDKQAQVEKECLLYEHLIKIFGKDGIQAYLIENAIPEIEEEANSILSRLTDNRTSIAIESVKDLQSGGSRETLDIKISDELGTRSYELYSGGEAFRVDFAIRVALSKLLATRAGTRLKTLVIDEGFGTQDARGLEQLVEAIKVISADFEKILVITHLESLKEAFPVRIEVVKLPDVGSQYQIVH